LAETVMTLPGTTVVEEFCPRNAAIDAAAAYCHFQEGGAVARKGFGSRVIEDSAAFMRLLQN
jgi:hypothetical protein